MERRKGTAFDRSSPLSVPQGSKREMRALPAIPSAPSVPGSFSRFPVVSRSGSPAEIQGMGSFFPFEGRSEGAPHFPCSRDRMVSMSLSPRPERFARTMLSFGRLPAVR